MLSILEFERKAALAPNPSDLVQANGEKETLLAHLQVLDGQRSALLAQIADHMDISMDRIRHSGHRLYYSRMAMHAGGSGESGTESTV